MNPEPSVASSTPPQLLAQLLSSAIVLNWDALTQPSQPGRVKVEYHIGADGALEYLKVWNGTREYWSLICEYSARLSWSDGPRFCNGFHSRSLARLLQSIIMNQTLCNQTANTNCAIEVLTPSPADIEAAQSRVSETFPPVIARRGSKRGAEAPLTAAAGS